MGQHPPWWRLCVGARHVSCVLTLVLAFSVVIQVMVALVPDRLLGLF